MAKPIKFVLVGGALLFGAAALFAQTGAPPGPMAPPPGGVPADELPPPRVVAKKPEAKPRNNIMGDWKLNQEQSDDPHQKLQQARENSNSGNRGGGGGGGGYGGPRIGFPGGTMGGGGMGGNGGGRGQGGSDNMDSIRDKINASNEINLSQKTSRDPEVDLVDESNHKTVFYTDGRKLDNKSKDASTDEVTAKWDGSRLVTDEKAPRGKFTRTYELSGEGTQLWEEIKINTGRGNYPVTIRYVYDAVDKEPPKTASQPPATSPVANPPNNH
jgi:hypothetical protein